jgi:hypothetical protein
MADFFSQNSAINQAIQAANFRNSLNNRALLEQQAAQKRLMNRRPEEKTQGIANPQAYQNFQMSMAQNQAHQAQVAADRAYNLQRQLISGSGSSSSSGSGSSAADKAASAQDKSISAADRARGDTLAASDRSRKETLAAQAAAQDKSIGAADRARGDTLAAQDRARREGIEGQSRIQSERFTQTSKLQSQAAAEANSNKESDRTAAMQAFLRFRKGA